MNAAKHDIDKIWSQLVPSLQVEALQSFSRNHKQVLSQQISWPDLHIWVLLRLLTWLALHYPFWAHLFALKQSWHTSSRTLQFLLYNYYQSWGHNKGLETLTFISTCTARKGTLLAAKLAISVMYRATFCIPFERESFYMKPVQSHPESETGNLSYSICSDTGTGLCPGLLLIHGCEVKLQLYIDSLRAFHTEPARQAKLQNKVYTNSGPCAIIWALPFALFDHV